MVCKEEVLLWFKDLDSFKRIDVLYELLNMCLPFEIRFIGSCIEELGKHTYQELRGPAIAANDLEKLSKDVSFNQGILDEGVRHRLLIYLSLLSSRNYSVAGWMYRKLLRTDAIEEYLVKEKGRDEVLHSEFLLLFTMALHHPAFTFEHKQFFSRILSGLIDIRENRISAKHSALGYPPGFGYPTQKPQEVLTVPVKTAPTSCGDSPSTVTFHQPPGLPHLPPPPPHLDFGAPMWSRPGFPYGAPEVPPFPTSTMSPLVSQAASPSQSRSTSPHRTPLGRPPPPPPAPTALQPPGIPSPTIPPTGGGVVQQPPPPPPMAVAPPINGPPPPPLPPVDLIAAISMPTPLEQLSQSGIPPPMATVFTVATPPPVIQAPHQQLPPGDEEPPKLNLEDKQLRDLMWPQPQPMNPEAKPNGIRFSSPCIGKLRPFLVEQMQAMNLDGENALHQSNSSGNSSPNETPPGTPSNTPSTTPHSGKSRMNGMPPFGTDTTSPPPAFSNSSVPYNFPQHFATMPPNRSMFHYNQAYRPTFTQYPTFPSDSNFAYLPYVHLMYSNPFPARTQPGCYNCGAPNHVGSECTSQNIEEITQKKTFQLEYTSPLPDSEK